MVWADNEGQTEAEEVKRKKGALNDWTGQRQGEVHLKMDSAVMETNSNSLRLLPRNQDITTNNVILELKDSTMIRSYMRTGVQKSSKTIKYAVACFILWSSLMLIDYAPKNILD